MNMISIGIEGCKHPLELPIEKERLRPEILDYPADPDNPDQKGCDYYLPRKVAEELDIVRPPVHAFEATWYRWNILKGEQE